MRDAVTDHLTSNNLIRPSQYGFIKSKLCITELLEFLEKTIISMYRGEAFDTVNLTLPKHLIGFPTENCFKK